MKSISLFIYLFLFFSIYNGSAQSDTTAVADTSKPMSRADFIKKVIPNTAYEIGEKLTYEVRYGFFKGGEAEMSIDLEPSGKGFVYHVKAIATTTGMATKFVTIHDVYESFIDVTTGLPIKAVRNIKENNYRHYNEFLFDRKNNRVYSVNTGVHETPANVLDLLSAFYYARRTLFKHTQDKNQIIQLDTYFDDDLYKIKIKFKKFDKIKTEFGKVNCLLFVPVIEEGSTFKKEKDFQIWISNDENLIPIRVVAELNYGSVSCDLIQFTGLKNQFNSIQK